MLGSSSKYHSGSEERTTSNPHYVGNEERWAEILKSVNVPNREDQVKFDANKLCPNQTDE